MLRRVALTALPSLAPVLAVGTAAYAAPAPKPVCQESCPAVR
jgi:hypothetical protein